MAVLPAEFGPQRQADQGGGAYPSYIFTFTFASIFRCVGIVLVVIAVVAAAQVPVVSEQFDVCELGFKGPVRLWNDTSRGVRFVQEIPDGAQDEQADISSDRVITLS